MSRTEWPINLVCSIGVSGPIKFVQMIRNPWLTVNFFGKDQLDQLGLCMGKNVKLWIFLIFCNL